MRSNRAILIVGAVGGLLLVVGLIVWLLLPQPGPPLEPSVTIALSAPKPTTPDSIVRFKAELDPSTVPKERVQEVRYIWDFGDGSTDSGEEVTHQYEEPGDYTVRLTVEVIDRDNRFYRARDQAAIAIALPPFPEPRVEARILPDPEEAIIKSHDTVTFDAELAFAEPPSPHLNFDVEYVWTLADEKGTLIDRLEGKRISYQFNPPQEYEATLQVTVRDQYGRRKSYTIQRTIPIENLPPEVGEVTLLDSDQDGVIEPEEPVIFAAEGSRDPDEGKLYYAWDFDNDGFIDAEGEEPKAKWEFLKPGTYTVILQVYDDYMKDRGQPPVTKVLTITVLGGAAAAAAQQGLSRVLPEIPMPEIPELGRVLASGGIGRIGELQLWNVAAGMNINPQLAGLVGYGASTSAVTLERTSQFPEVRRAFPNARVTTTILSARLFTGSVYYRAYGENVYISGGIGYLTLKGEHRSDHPRVLITGRDVVPFTANITLLTFGVAYKLGFAFLSLQVYFAF